jgi:hypothetical protein
MSSEGFIELNPVADMEFLGPAVGIDGEEGAEHFATLLEAAADGVVVIFAGGGGVGGAFVLASEADDDRSDLGFGVEDGAFEVFEEFDAVEGLEIDGDGAVVLGAGRGGEPFADFALEGEDAGFRERIDLHEGGEEGGGDVVGEIAGDPAEGGDEGEGEKGIAFDEGESGPGAEGFAEVGGKAAVEFEGGDAEGAVEERAGKGAEAGADFEDGVIGGGGKGVGDEADDMGVEEEVLAELFKGPEAAFLEDVNDFRAGHTRSELALDEVVELDGIEGAAGEIVGGGSEAEEPAVAGGGGGGGEGESGGEERGKIVGLGVGGAGRDGAGAVMPGGGGDGGGVLDGELEAADGEGAENEDVDVASTVKAGDLDGLVEGDDFVDRFGGEVAAGRFGDEAVFDNEKVAAEVVLEFFDGAAGHVGEGGGRVGGGGVLGVAPREPFIAVESEEGGEEAPGLEFIEFTPVFGESEARLAGFGEEIASAAEGEFAEDGGASAEDDVDAGVVEELVGECGGIVWLAGVGVESGDAGGED